jgi:hypothetical protein
VLAGRACGALRGAFGESFVVEGVALLPDRRVALRDVYGIERSGAWLWVGSGFVPVVLGGDETAAERLVRVEAELRARIRALPGGAGRVALLDARSAQRLRRPWLTGALVLGLGFASGVAGAFGLRAATGLLLLLAFGLLAEPASVRCGSPRVVGGALAACAVAPGGAGLALAPLALAFGWAALLACARASAAAPR